MPTAVLNGKKIVAPLGVACLLVLLGMLLIACAPNSPGAVLFPPVMATPHPSRQVVSDTLGWKQLWRQSLQISYGKQPLAAVIDNQVVMPIDNGSTGLLIRFDPKAGKLIWAQEFNAPLGNGGSRVDSTLVDAERFYLATPFVVKAFDLDDGKLLWTSNDLPGHTGYTLFATEWPDIIGTHGGGGYYFDTKMGSVSPANQHPELHEVEPNSPAIDLKILMNKAIVSNLVVADGKVYAITSDAALVAYNRTNGSEVGRMQFEGEPFITDYGNQYVLIATDSEMLVYLGDSHELRVFSRK